MYTEPCTFIQAYTRLYTATRGCRGLYGAIQSYRGLNRPHRAMRCYKRLYRLAERGIEGHGRLYRAIEGYMAGG